MIEMYETEGNMAFSGINNIVPAKEYTVNNNKIIFGESFYVGGVLYKTTQNRLDYLKVNTYEVARSEDAKIIFDKIKFDATLREKLSEIASGRLDYNLAVRNCNGWTRYMATKYGINMQDFSIYNMGAFGGNLGLFKSELHKEKIISTVYEILERDYPDIDYSTIDFDWNSNSLQVGTSTPYLSLTVSGKTYLIDGSLGNAFLNNQSGTEDNKLTILTGDGSDTIINSGDNAVINAGEGSDLIQDYGGGNTSIDLGNDNAADKLILRKENGSSTEIINAGATDQLVIQERDLLRIEQVGNDLKLVLSGAEVWMKDGVLNGPDDMLNLRKIVA